MREVFAFSACLSEVRLRTRALLFPSWQLSSSDKAIEQSVLLLLIQRSRRCFFIGNQAYRSFLSVHRAVEATSREFSFGCVHPGINPLHFLYPFKCLESSDSNYVPYLRDSVSLDWDVLLLVYRCFDLHHLIMQISINDINLV